MSRLRWEHLAFAVVAVLVALLDGGVIPDGNLHRAAEHLVALAGLSGIYVGRPLRRSARPGELVLPDSRPGAAGGPLLALVCLGALFAGGCAARSSNALFAGTVLGAIAMMLGIPGGRVSPSMLSPRWGYVTLGPGMLSIALAVGGCTVAERARIRDGLITTSIGAVNCAAPGLQAGIQAAVVQLLGSAVSGRGAGTAQEWRALGLGLRDKYGLPAAACAAEVVAKELAKLALPPGPTVASAAAPVVGFVQPQSSGTRAQAQGGALGLEAGAGGSSPGAGLAWSITVSEDDPAGRARAAAQWLRSHPGEW